MVIIIKPDPKALAIFGGWYVRARNRQPAINCELKICTNIDLVFSVCGSSSKKISWSMFKVDHVRHSLTYAPEIQHI